jgi:hypothetical protein
MSDSTKPNGPPMRTFDYTSHVGPNEKGLHDSAVVAQRRRKPGTAESPAPTTTHPDAPHTTSHPEG